MIPLGPLAAFANFLARPAAIIGRAQEVDWDDDDVRAELEGDETGAAIPQVVFLVALAGYVVGILAFCWALAGAGERL